MPSVTPTTVLFRPRKPTSGVTSIVSTEPGDPSAWTIEAPASLGGVMLTMSRAWPSASKQFAMTSTDVVVRVAVGFAVIR